MADRSSQLQQEIKQTKPFRSVSQEGVIGLLKTVDLLHRRIGGFIEPHGITMQQYNVLRILRGAGGEGCPTLEIITRMIEQAPGITRLLDRLERKHLVHRERCPTDRRQVTCRITPTGLALLARLDKVADEMDGSLLEPLSQAEQRQLVRLLDRVRAELGRTT